MSQYQFTNEPHLTRLNTFLRAQIEDADVLERINTDLFPPGLKGKFFTLERPPEISRPQPRFSRFTWPAGITFTESIHKYFWEGLVMRGSSTSIVHSPFPHFEEQKVAARLAHSRFSKTYTGKTTEEILEMWEEARQKGTLFHLYAEMRFNGVNIPSKLEENLGVEYKYFDLFVDKELPRRNWFVYRTEVILYDPESETCGMIDAIAAQPKPGGGYRWFLLDWKRTRTLGFKAFQGKTGAWPCQDLPDVNGSTYTLQLNLYKFLLKKIRNIDVEEMWLVRFHPEATTGTYEMYKVEPKQKIIEILLYQRRINLCRFDFARWLLGVHQLLDSTQVPGGVISEPPTKKTKNQVLPVHPSAAITLCELLHHWIRFCYRTARGHWESENSIFRRTHLLLIKACKGALGSVKQTQPVPQPLKNKLAHLWAGFEFSPTDLTWPCEEKDGTPSQWLVNPFSSPSVPKTRLLLKDPKSYPVLVKVLECSHPSQRVGLCESYDNDKFSDLHLSNKFTLELHQCWWHLFNIYSEKDIKVALEDQE